MCWGVCSEDGGLLTIGGIEPGLVDFVGFKSSEGLGVSSSLRVSLNPYKGLSEGLGLFSSMSSPPSSLSSSSLSSSSPTSIDPSRLIAWTSITSKAAYRVQILQMEADGEILGEGEEAFGRTLVDSG